jgi:hypothetical protein
MNDVIFNQLVLVLNTLTAVCIIAMLVFHKRMHVFPMSHKIGLWLGASGLLGQAYRNAIYLSTRVSPSDNDISFWVLKDAGYWAVLAGVIYHGIKKVRSK